MVSSIKKYTSLFCLLICCVSTTLVSVFGTIEECVADINEVYGSQRIPKDHFLKSLEELTEEKIATEYSGNLNAKGYFVGLFSYLQTHFQNHGVRVTIKGPFDFCREKHGDADTMALCIDAIAHFEINDQRHTLTVASFSGLTVFQHFYFNVVKDNTWSKYTIESDTPFVIQTMTDYFDYVYEQAKTIDTIVFLNERPYCSSPNNYKRILQF